VQVKLENVGKKFGREWIFRGMDYSFEPGKPVAVLGANGSGKSTLLQVVSGHLMQGEGKISYEKNGKILGQEEVYREVSLAAPYLELMEDFTLEESIAFHAKFKRWRNGMENQEILALTGLAHAKKKQVKNFSSGMKMRVRLSLAILSDTPVLLLDEPCSNLDKQACEWYAKLISGHAANRTVIVCSNQIRDEYFFCKEELQIEHYK
jgi:ABC-type multidrug transport system ATPase subunit